MAHDFLGNELSVGDDVVFLNYNGTSASLERGKITRVSEHTAEISGKRRAEYKIVKVNPVKPTMGNTWISCSERPPEELEPVNVVWVNHNPMPYYRYMKDVPQKATAVYYREAWYWWSCVCEDLLVECGANETDQVDDDIEITHWQPLPEPPKEENDETIDG
jgi:hypothetical protein